MSTPISSGLQPATPYASYLKKHYYGWFILALNSAFTQQLSLADEGYESGSNKDLPTPLCRTTCIHHVSSMEHASFNPVYSTPHRPIDPPHYDTQSSPTRPVCTDAYPSVATRIKKPPWYTWTLLIVLEIWHQNLLTMRNHIRMRISKQCLWMMSIGQQR